MEEKNEIKDVESLRKLINSNFEDGKMNIKLDYKRKGTSCPDQLSKALEEWKKANL